MENMKIITALLIGTVVGATIGLLLTPESGENLRKKIMSFGSGGNGEAFPGQSTFNLSELSREGYEKLIKLKNELS